MPLRDLKGMAEQQAGHLRQDQDQDDGGIALVGAPEAFRARHVAVVGGHGESHQDQQLEDVLEQGDPGVATDGGEAESGEEPSTKLLDQSREQDHEPTEDEEVKHPGVADPEQAGVPTDVGDNPPDPPKRLIEAVLGGSVGERTQHSPVAVARPSEGHHEEDQQGDCARCHRISRTP